MIEQLTQLDSQEKDLLIDVVPMITILIGGADGVLDNTELRSSERITKIRSYANSSDLTSYYEKVGERFIERIHAIIQDAPIAVKERTKVLSEEIAKVNPILSKLRQDQAVKFVASWRSFAKHVATASGGFFNYLAEGPAEAELVDLPMIDYKSEI